MVFSIFQARRQTHPRHFLLLSQSTTANQELLMPPFSRLLLRLILLQVMQPANPIAPPILVILDCAQDISVSVTCLSNLLMHTLLHSSFPLSQFSTAPIPSKLLCSDNQNICSLANSVLLLLEISTPNTPFLVLNGSHCVAIFPTPHTPHTAIRVISMQNKSDHA